MKVAAVIAEYNPFHKGHRWQLEQIRQRGATHIAVVMSPDYTQRGTPAILPKRVRAHAALENGADLILELPVSYACAGAQRFAFGAVSLVCAMGCVQVLAFGAEDAEQDLLDQAADALEHPQVQQALRERMAEGITFARARQQAVEQVFGERVGAVLSRPNNILAVEYLAQLAALSDGRIQPMAISRIGNAHDGEPESGFASASFLRGQMLEGNWSRVQEYLPQNCWEQYRRAAERGELAQIKTGERAVLSTLRGLSAEQLSVLPDLSEGLENRLLQASRQACTIEELYELVKTKRYPMARVRRLVMSAFLSLPGTMQQTPPPYLRILGMNERGREILSCMKQTATLPVSASLKRLAESGETAWQSAQLESRCADQYSLFADRIRPCGEDWRQSAVLLKSDD